MHGSLARPIGIYFKHRAGARAGRGSIKSISCDDHRPIRSASIAVNVRRRKSIKCRESASVSIHSVNNTLRGVAAVSGRAVQCVTRQREGRVRFISIEAAERVQGCQGLRPQMGGDQDGCAEKPTTAKPPRESKGSSKSGYRFFGLPAGLGNGGYLHAFLVSQFLLDCL